MTSLAPPLSETRPASVPFMPYRLATAFGLAALADWLFYLQPPGISAVLFVVAVFCCSLLASMPTASRQGTWVACSLVTASLVPATIYLDTLSILLLGLALASAVILLTYPNLDSISRAAGALRELMLIAPFRFARDAFGVFNLPAFTSGLAAWIVPVLMSCVFVMLFASANPLIENSLRWINLARMTEHLSLPRILFWILVLSLVWPFIHIRWKQRNAPVSEQIVESAPAELLDAATILRCLILFNLLFAVQTVLDAVYLWGGVTLPADVTYASYAHRGAYPLIVTALLAAAFVLVTMRPGGAGEQSKVIRPLVYLWVAQNVMLVISSILRLDLYVETYLLTRWRVAAFVWMLLVAAGLVFIIARIALGRSNEWLVRINLITLVTTLYACALVNIPSMIADYNVSHSREVMGKGVSVDMDYLFGLGPQALPAIDRILRTGDPFLVARRDSLVESFQHQTASWRAWGLRNWRLQHYLKGRQQGPAAG